MLTEIFDYYKRNIRRLNEKQLKKTLHDINKTQRLLHVGINELKVKQKEEMRCLNG
ncbi:hypothetical protein SAMN05421503_1458 [Terribacillus aidingensis]|uniref:Uncharacterized protein n=1 Tax=Terribacillus aidingensis TaxID=586416 RepID=A0A285NKH5_9BACI|nr:hypothetical protein [Terribacillus aidingensis]SNZ10000.1 hypothetical protein SAMN05421503_1458 [Terribacillus aidingensis]